MTEIGNSSARAADWPGPPPSRRVRNRAATGTILSALIAAGWVAIILLGKSNGVTWRSPLIALPLIPLVYFLTEWIFGKEVAELAMDWDNLAGWKRGVIGVLVTAGFLVLVMAVALGIVAVVTE